MNNLPTRGLGAQPVVTAGLGYVAGAVVAAAEKFIGYVANIGIFMNR